jgi:hypothetical protein
MSDRVHVTPEWEKHDDSPDCWCEPSVTEGGRLVTHHARTCMDGGPHYWVMRPSPPPLRSMRQECNDCGQPRAHVHELDEANDTVPPAICFLCGKPMPKGEEMFRFHGYSGPCPADTQGGQS